MPLDRTKDTENRIQQKTQHDLQNINQKSATHVPTPAKIPNNSTQNEV